MSDNSHELPSDAEAAKGHSPHHVAPAPRRSAPETLYVEAPSYYRRQPHGPPAVFLAGGITGVADRWHARAVQALQGRITTQPIAMYELGQALGEGRQIVVGADPAYPREADVHMLCRL